MNLTDHTSSFVAIAQTRLAEAGSDLTTIPITLQTVLLVHSAQGIIDNGGLPFFFEKDWPNNLDYHLFSEAYRRIGSSDAALHLDQAVAVFPFANPHLDSKRRIAFMTSLTEQHPFHVLSDSLCGDSTVWINLTKFINTHIKDFQRA